jgi:hypothetical protein
MCILALGGCSDVKHEASQCLNWRMIVKLHSRNAGGVFEEPKREL